VRDDRGYVTDLEAYEALEALAGEEDGPWHPPWQPCGTYAELTWHETGMTFTYEKCPKCPPEPHEVDAEFLCPNCEPGHPNPFDGEPYCPLHLHVGKDVTAYGKPGAVRWVTPWNSVAVVFEDGSMLWFSGEDVGQIGERE
jgi:hypothetical protein